MLDSSLCCETLHGADINNGSVLRRVYKKTRPFFDSPCDLRLVRTYVADVLDATVEAVSVSRLKSRAIMVKIGSGFDACFMAIAYYMNSELHTV